jgi:hypothetical protein
MEQARATENNNSGRNQIFRFNWNCIYLLVEAVGQQWGFEETDILDKSKYWWPMVFITL